MTATPRVELLAFWPPEPEWPKEETSPASSQEGRVRALVDEPDTHFEYRSPDGATVLPFRRDAKSIEEVAADYDICVTGDALTHAHGCGLLPALVPYVQVTMSRQHATQTSLSSLQKTAFPAAIQTSGLFAALPCRRARRSSQGHRQSKRRLS